MGLHKAYLLHSRRLHLTLVNGRAFRQLRDIIGHLLPHEHAMAFNLLRLGHATQNTSLQRRIVDYWVFLNEHLPNEAQQWVLEVHRYRRQKGRRPAKLVRTLAAMARR